MPPPPLGISTSTQASPVWRAEPYPARQGLSHALHYTHEDCSFFGVWLTARASDMGTRLLLLQADPGTSHVYQKGSGDRSGGKCCRGRSSHPKLSLTTEIVKSHRCRLLDLLPTRGVTDKSGAPTGLQFLYLQNRVTIPTPKMAREIHVERFCESR